MKQRLALGLWAWTTGLLLFFAAAEVRADSCYGGGSHPPPKYDGGKDVAVETARPGKRQLGLGCLAAASVGTVWLSFRRRDPDKRDE
jgi:hypothetical protein